MGKMISVRKTAELWNLTERRITALCREGSIPGAIKAGKHWMIPEDATRPADNRLKTGKYIQSGPSFIRLPLPVGVSDYRLASTKYYYIDKTMMLKELIDESPKVTLFTRPRRFGKTLNMDMIRTFFEKTNEDTSGYFINKQIWACGQSYRVYQGRYPAIFITLKDVKHTSWNDTREDITSVISREYRRHGELMDSPGLDEKQIEFYKKMASEACSEVELERSLFLLSEMLYKHYGEKALIIIDEYDTPIQSGHTHDFYDEVIAFMRNLLSGALKDNEYLAFGFLTGVLRVAKESIFSGLNNLTINSVLDNKYSKYFGFTEDEVRQMAEYYNVLDKYEEICEWYDGYCFGKTDIFNPWSVVNYFNNDCEPRAFWVSTGSNEIITEILKNAHGDISENLTALVNGESFTTYIDTSVIYPEITGNPSSLYSFLLVAGYLKVVTSSVSISGDFICEVALPNKEISLVYRKEILRRYVNMIPQPTAIAVEEAMFTGDGERLRDIIGRFLVQTVSSFDSAGENFYQGFMLGICALFGNSYVTSNRESGEGRYDIQLSPRSGKLPGVIIELKAGKGCTQVHLKLLAEAALKQINDRKYDTEMKTRGIEPIYKYGVAFCGKNVEVAVG